MRVIHSLSELNSSGPVILTIGNFDGVHIGHVAVLSHAKKFATAEQLPLAVLTFENHPSEVLRPDKRVPMLCTLSHKVKLLEEAGIDILIMLPFTKELSQLAAEDFLRNVYAAVPFAHLVLGHDATLGKDRQGNKKQIQAFSQHLNFHVHYIEPLHYKGHIVSSSVIRGLIQKNEFDHAAALLGRSYSVYGPVISGNAKGADLGFRTANIDVSSLCLPSFGVYAVHVKSQEGLFKGVANLGIAPTVRDHTKPLLEVHLLDYQENLYGQHIEVIFQQYIRPEKKFSSFALLQEQIAKDVAIAASILNVNNNY